MDVSVARQAHFFARGGSATPVWPPGTTCSGRRCRSQTGWELLKQPQKPGLMPVGLPPPLQRKTVRPQIRRIV